MAQAKEIEIYLIAGTQLRAPGVAFWLGDLGVYKKAEELGMTFDLPMEMSGAATLVGLAGKRCYNSFVPGLNANVTKTRRDWVEYLDNILHSGHGSVTEHSTYTFAFEGVSRVFTAELCRHRAGCAISEQSLRYVRFDENLSYWMPLLIQDAPDDSEEVADKKRRSRELFQKAFDQDQENYLEFCRIWGVETAKDFKEKKLITSAARRIVGMGVCTGIVWTGNLRALRHVLEMRCSPHAEEEICYVFTQVAKMMIDAEPSLFGDFHLKDGYYVPVYRKV